MVSFEESNLYTDPQRERRLDFCPCCGRERYAPGYNCLRCQGWPV